MKKPIKEISEKGLQVNILVPPEVARQILQFAEEREWPRTKAAIKLMQMGINARQSERLNHIEKQAA